MQGKMLVMHHITPLHLLRLCNSLVEKSREMENGIHYDFCFCSQKRRVGKDLFVLFSCCGVKYYFKR